jgi:hypothetical protein
MGFDRANLPTDIAELHQIILAQAAAGEAREAELTAAKAGLMAKALEVEKLNLQIARLQRMQCGRSSEKFAHAGAARAEARRVGGGVAALTKCAKTICMSSARPLSGRAPAIRWTDR